MKKIIKVEEKDITEAVWQWLVDKGEITYIDIVKMYMRTNKNKCVIEVVVK